MRIDIVKMFSGNLPSLKPILIGGKLIDYFNDQNNDLNIVVLKSHHIFNITIPNVSLKRPVIKESYLCVRPITDIYDRVIKSERVIAFIIGDKVFNIPFVHKDDNYNYSYDELCVLSTDIVNSENYKTIFPLYELSNYESVKTDLKHGIKLECFGLFNKITTPTGKLIVVQGESLLDGTAQLLIFEYTGN